MLRRCASNAVLLLFCSFALCANAFGQSPQGPAEIPIERCDVLPIVKVRIDGADMRFLLDTAATTMLNVKSFSSGRSKEIQVSSWSGTAATSAREVSLPELTFGEHTLRNLKLPAIDLSPIGNSCGGKIDGILGVDLLDKMGVTIDLKRKIAAPASAPPDAHTMYAQMETAMHHCTEAFNEGNATQLEDCFDPEIILYSPDGEFKGRAQVMKYLQNRYFRYAPNLSYEMFVREVRLFGDALWYTYDYTIDSPKEHLAGHGISMCRKDGDRWRILNLHNSHLNSTAANAKVEPPAPK